MLYKHSSGTCILKRHEESLGRTVPRFKVTGEPDSADNAAHTVASNNVNVGGLFVSQVHSLSFLLKTATQYILL